MTTPLSIAGVAGGYGVVGARGYKPCASSPVVRAAGDRIELGAPASYPSLDLAALDASGFGHTLRRHVAQDDAALHARAQRTLHDVSTFPDARTAQSAVDEAFRENQPRIGAWLASGRRSKLRLDVHCTHPLGRVYRYDLQTVRETSDAAVILERSSRLPQGYTVITAYPE